MLTQNLSHIEDFFAVSEEQLAQIPEIGPIMADSIVKFLPVSVTGKQLPCLGAGLHSGQSINPGNATA